MGAGADTPLRDRSKVQVQPYVPGTGGGMLRRAGYAAAATCNSWLANQPCCSVSGDVGTTSVAWWLPLAVQITRSLPTLAILATARQ